jgi:hypothetical protein
MTITGHGSPPVPMMVDVHAPRWFLTAPDDQLGVPVQGPVVLARSSEIIVAARAVLAYPSGLLLPIVLRASGTAATAAGRYALGIRSWASGPGPERRPSTLTVQAELNGALAIANPISADNAGGTEEFEYWGDHWLGQLPEDGRLRLMVSWADIGLSETTTTLTLTSLDGLADRVVTVTPG